jgi:amidophosphoribosyltransferase
MSTLGELFASRHVPASYAGRLAPATAAAMARALGVDSLRYLGVEDLPDCIGLGLKGLCLGCVLGKYPTDWGNRLLRRARRARKTAAAGRTYQ